VSVVDEPLDFELPNFEQLKTRHRELMIQYLHALDTARLLDSDTERFWATWRRATRLWVGSHIRARVLLLARQYAQTRQACDDEQEEMATWLDEARESCQTFADSLYSLRVPGFFALLPLAITVGTGLAQVPSLVFLIAFSSLAGYILFVPFIVISSFRQKRELLLPGARDIDKGRPLDSNVDPRRNVYRAEGDVFDLFAITKPKEFSVDRAIQTTMVWLASIAAVVVAAVLMVGDWWTFSDFGSILLGACIGVVGWPGTLLVERAYRRRTWR
jgi:hypothetical protein